MNWILAFFVRSPATRERGSFLASPSQNYYFNSSLIKVKMRTVHVNNNALCRNKAGRDGYMTSNGRHKFTPEEEGEKNRRHAPFAEKDSVHGVLSFMRTLV